MVWYYNVSHGRSIQMHSTYSTDQDCHTEPLQWPSACELAQQSPHHPTAPSASFPVRAMAEHWWMLEKSLKIMENLEKSGRMGAPLHLCTREHPAILPLLCHLYVVDKCRQAPDKQGGLQFIAVNILLNLAEQERMKQAWNILAGSRSSFMLLISIPRRSSFQIKNSEAIGPSAECVKKQVCQIAVSTSHQWASANHRQPASGHRHGRRRQSLT